jgi:hypothetical protein
MAIQSKETIKTYFETDDFPTQQNFADAWESYWHLQESATVKMWTATDPLHLMVQKLFEGNIVDYHIPVFIPQNKFAIFKAVGNTDNDSLEVGDVVVGFLGDADSFGMYRYNGGTTTDFTNYSPLFSEKRILPYGKLDIRKIEGNSNNNALEAGDIVVNSMLPNNILLVFGEFISGDGLNIENYNQETANYSGPIT